MATCVTPNVCSPMVIAPLRGAPEFAAIEYPIEPLPVPLAVDVTLSHETLVDAVQVQPAGDVTAIVPLPPAAAILRLAGERSIWHATPVCVRCARMSLRTRSPCRAVAVGFAATWNVTSPLPCPEVGARPVIQGAPDAAVQAHSGCVVTVTEPEPPAADIAAACSVSAT